MAEMKRFLVKVGIFTLLPLIIFLASFYLADGCTDPFYLRFTTPRQPNLILGTSRSAQGLQPTVFQDVLGKGIYNYSFTLSQSPYGAVYFNSIKKKLLEGDDGVFIVAVDPWSLSIFGKEKADLNSSHLRESNLCLATTNNVSAKPNFEYLFENLKGRFTDIIFPRNNNVCLHDDGWLEVTGIPMDSVSVRRRTMDKIKTYRDKTLPVAYFSEFRLTYLTKIIQYLSNNGRVYLVRLPVSPEMMRLENKLAADFTAKIQPAISIADGYLDMTPDNERFQYTDGNHLYKKSGELVSREIANWIKSKTEGK